jgi:hypothetical protein
MRWRSRDGTFVDRFVRSLGSYQRARVLERVKAEPPSAVASRALTRSARAGGRGALRKSRRRTAMLRIYGVVLGVVKDARPVIEAIERKDPDLARQMRRAVSSVALNISEGMYSRGKNRALGITRRWARCGRRSRASKSEWRSDTSERWKRTWWRASTTSSGRSANSADAGAARSARADSPPGFYATTRRTSVPNRHVFAWKRLRPHVRHFLPAPRICHPWPSQRLGVTTQGKSRMR